MVKQAVFTTSNKIRSSR